MSFKLRGIPEYLSVSGSPDQGYTNQKFRFTIDSTHSYQVLGNNGSKAWVVTGGSLSSVVSATNNSFILPSSEGSAAGTYTIYSDCVKKTGGSSYGIVWTRYFKDVDKEFSKFDKFLKSEGYFSSYSEGVNNIGVPKVIHVNGVDSDNWVANGTDGYKKEIPYSVHKKGLITGKFDEVTSQLVEETEDEGTLVIPRVKTYSLISGTEYEEVYDSASIDISSGKVTVYSNVTDPDYLVVIY